MENYIVAALYLWSAIVVAGAAFGWVRTARLLGGFSLKPIRQTARFARHSRRLSRWLALIGATTAGITLALTAGPTHVSLIVALACACLATCAAATLRALQPPSILFLTGSSPHAARLLLLMNAGLFPLRTVALLDRRCMSLWQRWAFLDDNLRTQDPNVWKSVVHRLIDMVGVVVIDTRGDSQAVKLETAIMLDPSRVRKALFITNPDGRSPALEVHGIYPSRHALRTVAEAELVAQLASCTASADSLPCPVDLRDVDDAPLASETFDSLPSVLMIPLSSAFDSDSVTRVALSSGKDLLAIHAPLSHGSEVAAEWAFHLSWEFMHDPRLVVLIFQHNSAVVVRMDFLRTVAGEAGRHVIADQARRLSFEELFQPEPIWQAVRSFADELIALAEKRGLTFRIVGQ